MSEILLKAPSIKELAGREFFVPNYQRGYRWEAEQVQALLDDLWEFTGNRSANEFYCLQPLVVIQRGSWWEVVDGQQRLTTLFLILREFGLPAGYRINYERHGVDVEHFLEYQCRRRPDHFYLTKAQATIREWVAGKDISGFPQQIHEHARFIRQVIKERGEAVAAFTRLNAGKIRLTDAELIRARLLERGQLSDLRRQQIALRWDQIELRLQDPEFRAFLMKKGESPENRIEWLFALLVKKKRRTALRDREVFTFLSEQLHEQADREYFWTEVEDLFDSLEEWYSNNSLYHLVGFLIWLDEDLVSLLNESATMGKKRFRNFLKLRIRENIFGVVGGNALCDALAGIEYPDSRIERILLCLNIAALEEDENQTVRFSFHSYKNGEWDIEHVRATAARPPENRREWVSALEVMEDYLKRLSGDDPAGMKAVLKEIPQHLEDISSEEELGRIYNKVRDRIEGDEDLGVSNGLGNLTLLDAGSNRGIGNSPFTVKRAYILAPERQGRYLLPATRNVFTKSYSAAPINLLHWTPRDAEEYRNGIISTLDIFFSEIEDGAS